MNQEKMQRLLELWHNFDKSADEFDEMIALRDELVTAILG